MVYRSVVMNLLLLALLSTMNAGNLSQSNPLPLPKLIHTVSPFFDAQTVLATASGFSRAAIPGFVNLDVEISNEGKILSTKYVGGQPFLMIHLMESTKAAISQWRFESVPEGDKTRKVQLRLFYDETGHVKVSPYEITLDINYDCPSKDAIDQFASTRRFTLSEKQCEVHKQLLRSEKVKIVYGLLGYRKGFWKAHEKYFPHDNFYIDGGCVVESRYYGKCIIPAPEFGEISYCPKCRATSDRWDRQHKHVKFE